MWKDTSPAGGEEQQWLHRNVHCQASKALSVPDMKIQIAKTVAKAELEIGHLNYLKHCSVCEVIK